MRTWLPYALVVFLFAVGAWGSSGIYAEHGYTEAILTFIAYWVMWTSAYIIIYLGTKR